MNNKNIKSKPKTQRIITKKCINARNSEFLLKRAWRIFSYSSKPTYWWCMSNYMFWGSRNSFQGQKNQSFSNIYVKRAWTLIFSLNVCEGYLLILVGLHLSYVSLIICFIGWKLRFWGQKDQFFSNLRAKLV